MEDDAPKDNQQPQAVPSLDDLHQGIMANQGDDLREPEPEGDDEEPKAPEKDDKKKEPKDGEKDDPKKGDKKKAEPKGGDGDEDKPEPDGGDNPGGKKAGDEPSEPTPRPAPPKEAPKLPKEPKVNEDVTKPGKYKAKFVDAEGKTYYISDVDQLPNDFEPQNYKDYTKSTQQLYNAQAQFKEDTGYYKNEVARAQRQEQIDKIKQGWLDEIDQLTSSGKLPKDKEEREKVVDGVYKLIDEELKAGNPIPRWSQAHRIYAAESKLAEREAADKGEDKEKDDAEEEARKQKAKDKKKKGGKVMGSGTGKSPASNKTPNTPPSGVSLDDVHAQVMRELGRNR